MRFKLLFLLLPVFLHAMPGYIEPWGKDTDLKIPEVKEIPPPPSFAIRVAEKVIRFHQDIISPVDGPRSHFRPTSSTYMLQSMKKHGFITGFWMGCDRLMRENSDEWVYRKIEKDGKLYKYDPVR